MPDEPHCNRVVTLDLLIDGCANTLWRTIMKKGLLLNAPLNAVIAECGHTDQICLCDAGLPIPAEVTVSSQVLAEPGLQLVDAQGQVVENRYASFDHFG